MVPEKRVFDELEALGCQRIGRSMVDDGGGEGKGGKGTLFINGEKVGEGRIEKTAPARFGIGTFGVGKDTGSPVSNAYKPPFSFNGDIAKVDIVLK